MDALLPAMLANALVAVGLMAVAFGVAALQRPRAAHAAWHVVLAKLVTPPLVVIPVVLTTRAAVEPLPTPHPVEPSFPTLPPVSAVDTEPPTLDLPPAEPTPDDPSPAGVIDPVPPVLAAGAPVSDPVNWGRVAFFAWGIGAVGWVGLVVLRVGRFRRFVATASPADGETIRLARDVAARLGLRRVPQVSFVDGPVSPMLWAVVGRLRILLPRTLWANFTPDHREAVLAHELAHLARGDHWTRRFELIVLAMYWWCPVAWVAVRELRRAEEACCDGRVMAAVPGRAAAYAEALVETMAFVNRPGWVPLASGGAARATDLKRRVTMILNATGGTRANPWLPAAVFLLGVAVLPLAPGLADEPKPASSATTVAEDPPPPPEPPPPATRWRVTDDGNRARAVEEYKRLGNVQSTAPAADASRFTTSPYLDESAKTRLKDEVELLEAQMEVKRAHIRAAERGVKAATTAFDRMKQARNSGAVSAEQYGQAEEALEKSISELDIRKAEMNEHQVRLTQTKRRLSEANAPAARAPNTTTPWVARPATTTPAPDRNPRPDAAPAARAVPAPRPPATTERRDPPAASTLPSLPVRNRDTRPDTLPEARSATRASAEKQIEDLVAEMKRTDAEIAKMQKLQSDLKNRLLQLTEEQRRKEERKEEPKPEPRFRKPS